MVYLRPVIALLRLIESHELHAHAKFALSGGIRDGISGLVRLVEGRLDAVCHAFRSAQQVSLDLVADGAAEDGGFMIASAPEDAVLLIALSAGLFVLRDGVALQVPLSDFV